MENRLGWVVRIHEHLIFRYPRHSEAESAPSQALIRARILNHCTPLFLDETSRRRDLPRRKRLHLIPIGTEESPRRFGLPPNDAADCAARLAWLTLN
jgi:hypothetical protein